MHGMLVPLPLTLNGVGSDAPTLVPTQAQHAGSARVGYLDVVVTVRQAGCAGMRGTAIKVNVMFVTVDVEIDTATGAVGGEDRAGERWISSKHRGAMNTAAIARNAIAMPPVNWVVTICGRRRSRWLLISLVGGFFLLFCC